jgi:hypothetical protein
VQEETEKEEMKKATKRQKCVERKERQIYDKVRETKGERRYENESLAGKTIILGMRFQTG